MLPGPCPHTTVVHWAVAALSATTGVVRRGVPRSAVAWTSTVRTATCPATTRRSAYPSAALETIDLFDSLFVCSKSVRLKI